LLPAAGLDQPDIIEFDRLAYLTGTFAYECDGPESIGAGQAGLLGHAFRRGQLAHDLAYLPIVHEHDRNDVFLGRPNVLDDSMDLNDPLSEFFLRRRGIGSEAFPKLGRTDFGLCDRDVVVVLGNRAAPGDAVFRVIVQMQRVQTQGFRVLRDGPAQ
jgi:hypothetical protein